MFKYVHTFLCTFLLSVSLGAQTFSSIQIDIQDDSISLPKLLTTIEDQSPYSFSYDADFLSNLNTLQLSKSTYSINELFELIENRFGISSELQEPGNKIILFKIQNFTLKGFVKDSLSGESLQGVLIHNEESVLGTSNAEGFFSINLSSDNASIFFNYLGYESKSIPSVPLQDDNLDVLLSNKNILSKIVITDKEYQFNNLLPEKRVNRKKLAFGKSILGNEDVFSYLRLLPGVSVGSEGQNGFNVRGGGQEQNLILLDGLPVYEASHLGGLSSIFISDAIKNIDFYKSGFPARYGGKLSSVVDIRLKDGHRTEFKRSINFGIEGVEGHIEGPLSEKTTINLNGKFSWFSLLASPLLEQNLEFNNSTLKYSDGYAKLSHWFSPSSRISFTAYSGNDLIRLSRTENPIQQSYSFSDINRIEWGNKLYSLSWNLAMKEDLFLNSSIGFTTFNYSSRGSYYINYVNEDSIRNTSFDILSNSKLRDLVVNFSIDQYTKNFGNFKYGISTNIHRNAPSIKESENFLDPDLIPSTELDSTYNSYELIAFTENQLYLSPYWKIHSGLRLNYYGGLDKSYLYLQPRLLVKYEKPAYQFGFSYAKMSQFIHLLVNPGPGLPSDLWVPSTEKVAPEISDLFDISFNFRKNNMLFGLQMFYNKYSNVIAYSNVSDILYSLIIDNQLFNVAIDNTNWEERISSGTGRSFGIEVFTGFETDVINWSMSYTLSKSDRQFDDLNEGVRFPYKYDRRHNLSSQMIIKLKKANKVQINFAYGTGNSFTLLDQEIKGVDCTPRIVQLSRNNGRVPDFHHLDILYSNEKILKNGRKMEYSIGVYNVYNRLNPFYVYLFQDPETLNFDSFRKISIYPIIPKLNIKYLW